MRKLSVRRVVSMALAVGAIGLVPLGCDEYEQEQLRQAGDDLDAAGRHVGEASGSALGRARQGTSEALQNLSNQIDTNNDRVNDAADQANPN